MAEDVAPVIQIKDDFHRDGFGTVLWALGVVCFAIALLALTSLYISLSKPAPVHFSTDHEWRIIKPVPLMVPYLSTPDLAQWVSNVLPNLFNLDFINYKAEREASRSYFTDSGWQSFLMLLDNNASYNTVTQGKLFVSAAADSAPFVLNQGILNDRYAWWVQMSVQVNYSSGTGQPLDLQVLVVRVPTLDNAYGVAIDRVMLAAAVQKGSKARVGGAESTGLGPGAGVTNNRRQIEIPVIKRAY